MSDTRANQRVLIATTHETVVLPWESRQALVERLRGPESGARVIAEFEAAGTSRPVTLDIDAKQLVVDTIAAWSRDSAPHGLPGGVWELLETLIDDLREENVLGAFPGSRQGEV